MAAYDLYVDSDLGWSHCGCVTVDSNGTVELTDEEVAKLVNLIKEKGTSDVEELGLKHELPDIYEKLDKAHRDIARIAIIDHWLMEGYYENAYECDMDELMEHCTENHGFEFSYDEADYTDEDGNVDEDAIYDARFEAFTEWLEPFILNLDYKERRGFLEDQMGIELDYSDLEIPYTIEIPQAIVKMAEI